MNNLKKLLSAIFLILFFSGAIADVTEFSLAQFNKLSPISEKQQILENQIKPINEAFNLNADISEIEATAEINPEQRSGGFFKTGIVTILSTKTPETGVDYEVVRNGITLDQRTTTVQQGDSIIFTPQIEIDKDWIVPAGALDSPPITLIPSEEYNELHDSLRDDFRNRYPSAGSFAENVPVFTAEKTMFNEQQGYYLAENGHLAYVTPILNGQKAGVQIICRTDFGESSLCKNIDQSIECKIEESGKIPNLVFSRCFIYIDKIINGGEATQAGWFSEYEAAIANGRVQDLEIQVIQSNEEPPVADFVCRSYEKMGAHGLNSYIECDASESYDPDGTIDEYYWDTFYGATRNDHGKIMNVLVHSVRLSGTLGSKENIVVELKVTDDDGVTSTKTKNLRLDELSGEFQTKPLFRITADHNASTNMAEITAECEGVVTLDIEEATEGKTELEKVEIPCGETTDIGPFTVKNSYRVIGSNNGETKYAIFTVRNEK